MTFDGQFFARTVEVLFPPAFGVSALFKRSCPLWAKGLAVGAAIVGLVAATLDFVLPHYRAFGLTADDYVVLMRLKHILVGVVGGIVISVVVAYEATRRKAREASV